MHLTPLSQIYTHNLHIICQAQPSPKDICGVAGTAMEAPPRNDYKNAESNEELRQLQRPPPQNNTTHPTTQVAHRRKYHSTLPKPPATTTSGQ